MLEFIVSLKRQRKHFRIFTHKIPIVQHVNKCIATPQCVVLSVKTVVTKYLTLLNSKIFIFIFYLFIFYIYLYSKNVFDNIFLQEQNLKKQTPQSV